MVDDDYRATAAQALAQAEAARAALAALRDKRDVLQQDVVQAQDAVAAADAQLTHAANEVHRQQVLLPTASGLLQSLQAAQAVLRRTEATRAQAVAQVWVNQGQIDLLDAQILQAQAQVGRRMRRSGSLRSRSATPASSRRSTARSASARCMKARCSHRAPRSTR